MAKKGAGAESGETSARNSVTGAGERRSYLMQQGHDIWIEEAEKRPTPEVPPGTKRIRAVAGPSNEIELKSIGDRMVASENARWR